MRRVAIPELLDTDAGTPAEIAASLTDLGRINRWFGGISTSSSLLQRVAQHSGKANLSVLDVASGSGELPFIVRDRLQRRGIKLSIALLDRARSHLPSASNVIVGDVLAMPLPDHAFDIVSSSLFLHHLEPHEVVQFANECLRVCRVAVIINDVRRSLLHLAAVYAGLFLFRSRLTHHDAPASVRRAYTAPELRALLEQSRAARIEMTTHFLFRMGVILWR